MLFVLLLAALGVGGEADPAPLGPNESEIRAWERLYDGRLAESYDRAPSKAVEHYAEALDLLQDEGHPLRVEILYWDARARYHLGDLDGAASALHTLAERGGHPLRERTLLGWVLAAQREVVRLPFRQDFSEDALPWVPSWLRVSPDRELSIEDDPLRGRVLVWDTLVRQGEDDFLFIPFRAGPPGPRQFRLRLGADGFAARVRFLLEDVEGQQWSSRAYDVPLAGWVDVTLGLDGFALVGNPLSGRRPDPAEVRSFRLVDVTGYGQAEGGQHRIVVDDLEIR